VAAALSPAIICKKAIENGGFHCRGGNNTASALLNV